MLTGKQKDFVHVVRFTSQPLNPYLIESRCIIAEEVKLRQVVINTQSYHYLLILYNLYDPYNIVLFFFISIKVARNQTEVKQMVKVKYF